MIRRVLRGSTAPMRSYLNEHFEQVKAEVRLGTETVISRTAELTQGSGGAASVSNLDAWTRVNELESSIAEVALHQSRTIDRLTDEVSTLSDRIVELERVVASLAAVVGDALTDAPSSSADPAERQQ